MNRFTTRDLAYYRLEQARECLESSKALIDIGKLQRFR